MFRILIAVISFLSLFGCSEPYVDFDGRRHTDRPRPPVDYSVRQENKRLIAKCASSIKDLDALARVHHADSVNGVDMPGQFRILDSVNWEDTGDWTDIRYGIRKVSDTEMGLNLRIGFWAEDSERDQKDQMIKVWSSCTPKLAELFGRYGINLDIQYVSTLLPDLPDVAVQLTRVRDQSGSHSTLWRTYPEADHSPDCSFMVHEMGHFFGLYDEYYDKRYPQRVTYSEWYPYNIMRDTGYWDENDFYPRNIKQIFRPVCPDL